MKRSGFFLTNTSKALSFSRRRARYA